MRLPEVLVIFGVKGSGKDTACLHFEKRWPGVTRALMFAEKLKEVFCSVFPLFPKEWVYGDTKLRELECEAYPLPGVCLKCGVECEKLGIPRIGNEPSRWWKCIRCNLTYPRYLSARIGLQSLGTEWGRRLFLRVWIDLAFYEARLAAPCIITDGRFFNEFEACRQEQALIVFLTRGIERSTDPHDSEAQLRSMYKEIKAGKRHVDILLDNEHLTVEPARDRLFHDLRTLADQQVQHVKWSNTEVPE